MQAPIVTLTTDWGNDGLFSGMVKGRLCSLIDGVRVVDITHSLAPYDLRATIFMAQHALMGFPPGTVHIIDVASGQSAETAYIAVRAEGQYFICTDNGLPALLFGGHEAEAVRLALPEGTGADNFVAHSLFCHAAMRLCQGAALADIGTPHTAFNRRLQDGYVAHEGQVDIFILYTDSYGNAYLGLSYDEFEQMRAGRPFELRVRNYFIHELSRSYYDVPGTTSRQKLRLTVSATGMLELAVTEESFSQLMGLATGDLVILRFK